VLEIYTTVWNNLIGMQGDEIRKLEANMGFLGTLIELNQFQRLHELENKTDTETNNENMDNLFLSITALIGIGIEKGLFTKAEFERYYRNVELQFRKK
jgi:hypothetical protein